MREIPAYAGTFEFYNVTCGAGCSHLYDKNVGFYAGYEYTKRNFQAHYNTDSIPVWATLTAGGIGGLSYWTACYPLGKYLPISLVNLINISIESVLIMISLYSRCCQISNSTCRQTSSGSKLYHQHIQNYL